MTARLFSLELFSLELDTKNSAFYTSLAFRGLHGKLLPALCRSWSGKLTAYFSFYIRPFISHFFPREVLP